MLIALTLRPVDAVHETLNRWGACEAHAKAIPSRTILVT